MMLALTLSATLVLSVVYFVLLLSYELALVVRDRVTA